MLKLETALDSWREWDIGLNTRPVLVNPLGGGRSNRSFLLESGCKKMVIRINAPPTALPNPDRAVEARVWRAASEAGIAPQLLHADPGGAFLVSAYIENELSDRPQDNPGLVKMAQSLLQRCHQLDVTTPTIDYARHIDRYWQIIEERELACESTLREQREPMRSVLDDLIDRGTPSGLCHHDPVIENFVGGSRKLYLIDWEYAAHGRLILDYAAMGLEWSISTEEIAAHTGIETKLLLRAGKIYRYQCALWKAVTQAVNPQT